MEIKPKKQSFFRRNLFSIISIINIIIHICVIFFLNICVQVLNDHFNKVNNIEKILKQNNLTLKEDTTEENKK